MAQENMKCQMIYNLCKQHMGPVILRVEKQLNCLYTVICVKRMKFVHIFGRF